MNSLSVSGKNWVLKNISFEVKPGKTLALVGATGAGKSSIVNLLNRFYETNRGHIYLDDREIKDYDLSFLRRNIALVLQDVFLFSDSIFNNITLKNPNISCEQVYQAANLVGASAFIERLPGGYDYGVMERGATLSVGQRQLISFVRALVYDPKIIKKGIMRNLIGKEIKKSKEICSLGKYSSYKKSKIYNYGKKDVKEGRKMGHINFS